jgi:hypothetical protein
MPEAVGVEVKGSLEGRVEFGLVRRSGEGHEEYLTRTGRWVERPVIGDIPDECHLQVEVGGKVISVERY